MFSEKILQFSSGNNGHQEHNIDAVLYQYGVIWIGGCDSTRQRLPGKLEPPESDYPTCQSLFQRAFEDCNNGGIGGYVDVDCPLQPDIIVKSCCLRGL